MRALGAGGQATGPLHRAAAMSKFTLRLRGPDGMVRLDLNKTDTFRDLGEALLPKLPPTVDRRTITISNAPTDKGDRMRLGDILKLQLGKVGLK